METESAYHKEQRENAERVQATGPLYAAEFTRLSGSAWSYIDPIPPGGERDVWNMYGYKIRDVKTGREVYLYVSFSDKKVTASPSMPRLPNGTGDSGSPAAWREYGINDSKGNRVKDAPTAGVALDRFFTAVPACAKRFYTLVALPLAEYWPQVEATINLRLSAYSDRDKIAAELAAEFGGTFRKPPHGGEALYVSAPGVPGFTVTAGGYIRLEHAGFTVRTLRAYLRAHLAEPADLREAAERVLESWNEWDLDGEGKRNPAGTLSAHTAAALAALFDTLKRGG